MMKVKAQRLKAKRQRNRKDPWHRVRPMDRSEIERAKTDIVSLLQRHQENGLYYGDAGSPEEAILKKLPRRSKYGNRQRQLLVFKSVLGELGRLGAISYDPVRQRLGYYRSSYVR